MEATRKPELQLEGLAGPTHRFSGLAPGNRASLAHRGERSSPRSAALASVRKMRRLLSLGQPVALLPPQHRPHFGLLRQLGFVGTEREIVEAVWRVDPALLEAASSSAFMWAANAGTVSPSADTVDGRLHVTPANRLHNLHRFIEAEGTERALKALFAGSERFCVHPPLPPHPRFADEGAANHTRLLTPEGPLHLYVYGAPGEPAPRRFPARQAREAFEAIARSHGVDRWAMHVRLRPEAIDAGVFHADVAMVGVLGTLLVHERALFPEDLDVLRARLGEGLVVVEERELSLDEAVRTYLFNGLLLPMADGTLRLVLPAEVEDSRAARTLAHRLVGRGAPAIAAVETLAVEESMKNGGGPACLRLRVPLEGDELAKLHQGFVVTPEKLDWLEDFVRRRYRDRLEADDLRDPQLLTESRLVVTELETRFGLGSVRFIA
ncbi:MAG: N-succinylarginine dihydrolase [Myxococcales bacterium]|nr:N-succinylarginine dihydrolase [Myxococcales bacterium]